MLESEIVLCSKSRGIVENWHRSNTKERKSDVSSNNLGFLHSRLQFVRGCEGEPIPCAR